MPYEVLVDEYTIHRDVRELTNKDGQVTGRQLGLGKTHYRGEVVPDAQVGQVYKDALEDEDHEAHAYVSARLREVDTEARQNTAERLGVPFAGYDDMDEDAVVTAMRHLPSGLIQAIKKYEAEHGENRDKIVQYNIGYGSDPAARQEGRVGSGGQDEDSEGRQGAAKGKATAKLQTRNISDDDVVTPGEGVTGTGDGKIVADRSEGDKEAPKKVVRNRRGRRDRPAGEGSDDK